MRNLEKLFTIIVCYALIVILGVGALLAYLMLQDTLALIMCGLIFVILYNKPTLKKGH